MNDRYTPVEREAHVVHEFALAEDARKEVGAENEVKLGVQHFKSVRDAEGRARSVVEEDQSEPSGDSTNTRDLHAVS